MKHNFYLIALLTLILQFAQGVSHAQSVTGPTSVYINSTHTYTYASTYILSDNNWVVMKGSKISESRNGTTYSVTVTWTSTGSGLVRISEPNDPPPGWHILSGLTVTVNALPAPEQPTATAANSITSTSFTANWNTVSNATSYRLDVSTNSSFSTFVTGYNNLSVSGTNQNITGLAPNTTYYYRVRAVNGSGTSTNSNTITTLTVPDSPTTNSASSITATSFVANWNSVAGSTGYRLDVSTNSSFSTYIAGYNNLAVSSTSQIVLDLAAGTTYYYRVRAENGSGASANSGTVSALTIPAVPLANNPTSSAMTSFAASWNSVTSATGYLLDVSPDNSFSTFVSGYNNLSVASTSQIVTGLSAGTTYYYRVRSVNSSGTSSNSNSITVLTTPAIPIVNNPTSFTNTTFTANWSSVTSATSYLLEVSANSSFSTFISGYDNLSVLSTSQVVTGLSPGTIYYYRVKSVNSSGFSHYSAVVSGLTTPSAPQANNVTSVGVAAFTLSWNSVPTASSYQVDVSTSNNFSSFLPGYASFQVNGTSHTVTEITEADEFYYRVRAVNGSGASPNSNIIEVSIFDQNYVQSIDILVENVKQESEIDNTVLGEKLVKTDFFDGLGRPSQSISHQQSPNQLDIIQPIVYDEFGRETIKYLPFASGNSGLYKLEPVGSSGNYEGSSHHTFYNESNTLIARDEKPYAVTVLEPSPLNRAIKQGSPGSAWQPDATNSYTSTDRTIKLAYEFNEPNEVLHWTYAYPTPTLKFGLVSAGTAAVPTYYLANQLFRNKTKDEQHHQVIEYKDKSGKIVLKRVQTSEVALSTTDVNKDTNYASTYYIYDDFGNLVCVIPPEATKRITAEFYDKSDTKKDAFLKRWAFRYTYDGEKRMIQKQVPGAEPVFMVYDNRDRLVLTQDGNQRVQSKWMFTKYDVLNRPVSTGFYTSGGVDQASMQVIVNNYYNVIDPQTESWFESFTTAAGNIHGYDNKSFPVVANLDDYLTVTYYDNYNFKALINAQAFDFVNNELSASGNMKGQDTAWNNRVTGQVTGSKIRMITTASWLRSANYYDDKHRLIQTISENPKGHEVTTNVLDFVGKVLRTKTSLFTGQPSVWTNIDRITIAGDLITSTSAATWNDGAASTQTLAAGSDGWVEFTVVQTTTDAALGFSDQNSNNNPSTTDFHWRLVGVNSTARPYTNSTAVSSSIPVFPGDVLRVERVNGKIYWKRNGTIVYPAFPSTISSTTVLMADLALSNGAAKVSKVRLSPTFSSFAATPQSITKRFEYDHAGRALNIWHQLNAQPEILLTKNEYNELGQLIDKKIHSTVASAANAKQSVDYRYNIRGWLTSINNSQLANDPLTNDDANDFFGMNLGYNDDLGTGNSANLQYNGNINAITYSTNLALGSVKEMGYKFTYDPLNRLQHANHLKNDNLTLPNWTAGNYSENNLTYDLNGNIKTLQRTGDGGVQVDNLTYNYSDTTASNKLVYVRDLTANATDKIKGFNDRNGGASIDYTYDANGNMLTDKNKNILTDIAYNYLNLPEKVTRNNNSVTYIYDATGRKQAQVANFGKTPKYTEYVGAWVFENDQPQFVQHEEGRIVLSETKQIFSTDGDDETVAIPSSNVTITKQTINGETYLKVAPATGIVLTKLGATQLGGTFPVNAGERFTFRVKGYSNTSKLVQLNVVGNGTDLIWGGASMQTSPNSEMWVENHFTVPAGITEISLGVLYWNTSTSIAGDYFYINEAELVQTNVVAPEYQYNLKDHLGNVRLTFTTKQEADTAIATLETAHAVAEQSEFIYYDEAVKINSPLFDHTNNDSTTYATRLTGGNTNEKYGLAKSLSVMPGDTLNIEVFAKYLDTNSSNWTTALSNFLASIANSTAPAGTFVDGGANGSIGSQPFPFIGALTRTDDNGTGPKAYINYILFDRNFVYKTGGFKRISSTPRETGTDVAHERLAFDNLVITEPGYIYIYLSNENETEVEVYFDDFKVEHKKSPVIQTDEYYPFGLTFNSYSRENSIKNNYLYNGFEIQDELDLGWFDYLARQYDPAIGRFTSIDPAADLMRRISPYAYAYNNPIRFTDPDGMVPEDQTLDEWVAEKDAEWAAYDAGAGFKAFGAFDGKFKGIGKEKDPIDGILAENGVGQTREEMLLPVWKDVLDGTITLLEFLFSPSGKAKGLSKYEKIIEGLATSGDILVMVNQGGEIYNKQFLHDFSGARLDDLNDYNTLLNQMHGRIKAHLSEVQQAYDGLPKSVDENANARNRLYYGGQIYKLSDKLDVVSREINAVKILIQIRHEEQKMQR